MPHDIDEAFAAAGVSLFPGDARELVSSCSCPDWSNPCKHVAAVYYLLAEAFDDDPFLIFAWRGRGKDTILGDLRALRGTTNTGDGAGSDHEGIGGRRDAARSVPPVAAAPLADCLDQFWSTGDLAGLRIRPRAARVPDALLRTLDPAPVDPVTKADPVTRDLGRRLAELLAPAYQTLTAAAAARALGGAPHDGDQGE
jgi:uncharacterized Zn finger protein